MKALLVIESDKTALEYAAYLTLEGCECIRYRMPLKAMDNLEEIDPQMIVISATDFPRHWKPFVQFAQNTLPAGLPVCLLTHDKMEDDEEKKAEYLGVSGVFEDSLNDKGKSAIRQLLADCVLAEKPSVYTQPAQNNDETDICAEQTENAEIPAEIEPEERLLPQFIFIHPDNGKIITGKTVSRTEDGIIFKPDWPDELEGLTRGAIIPVCSLYMRGDCINPKAEVLFAGNEYEFAFI